MKLNNLLIRFHLVNGSFFLFFEFVKFLFYCFSDFILLILR